VRLAAGLALTGICASRALGQAQGSDDPPSDPPPPACHGERISRIDIQTLPPFEPATAGLARRLAQTATELHSTTRPKVVRRYLAMHEGDACSTFLVRESERILRAQPFIADASIAATPDGNGGVVINVVTVDEVSLVLDGSGSTKPPVVRAVRIGEENLGGEALSTSVGWQHGVLFRDIYKARLVDYQFLGFPYQLSMQGVRNEIGGSWDILASHPFFTDLQRWSWRASAGASTGYLYFLRPGESEPALQFTRAYRDIGAVAALGRVAHKVLIGGTISHERERPGRLPAIVSDSGIFTDTSSVLVGRYTEHRSTRLNLLLGFRNIRFVTARGFDAVEGTQDVRTGFQFSTLLGRGFRLTDQDERDYFVSADIYGGHATSSSFTGFELLTERRRNLETHEWDGILASGRAAWYVHPGPKHTSQFDLEYSGGSRQRVPFQLTFADREGGLRGYGSSDLGGAERLVARVEDRYQLGHVKQFAGLAGAVFMDAGKLWAGDVPFGTTTGVKTSVGVSLLAALPPRSRRTWRVDFAYPLNDRHDAKFEVRFSNHDFTRWFWREPGDVQTSRERAIPNSVYNWP
jgi:hypothetical protein